VVPGNVPEGRIFAVCLSEKKGEQKSPRAGGAMTVAGHGFEGDAHAGKWHRQISLLSRSAVEYMRERGADVDRGSFGENIIVEGIEVDTLPVGTHLRVGSSAILRVTQIGKECHSLCAIGLAVGECVMPKRGIFCEVIEGGPIKPGDLIRVVEAPQTNSTSEVLS